MWVPLSRFPIRTRWHASCEGWRCGDSSGRPLTLLPLTCEFSHRVFPTVLDTQQLTFPLDEDDAFDEMNLVEIPFALPHMRAANRTRANLTADGTCYLATTKDSLPTALAQRVVLGLLWLTKEQNGFGSPQIEFTLRRLIQSFMYPARRYRANARTLEAVRTEIYRVMATQLHHDRWFDRARQRHVKVAAAIFDNVQELQPELGLGTTFSLRWGHFVYESVRASYTKPLDLRTWLRISNPIDQTLYRWLDRQLATKDVQAVRSSQNFAKYKLLLESQRLSNGGRAASSYVIAKLTESLQRLNGVGVAVRMVVDDTRPDFSLEFHRIAGQDNEVVHGPARHLPAVEMSSADRIVLRFRQLFHGLPQDAQCTIDRRDRRTAGELLATYGEERALELLDRAHALHRGGERRGELLHFLSGAMVYFNAAEAEVARAVAKTSSLDEFQARQSLWDCYMTALLDRPGLDQPLVEAETERRAAEDIQQAGRVLTETLRKRILDQHRREAVLELQHILPKKHFFALPERELRPALIQRHGFDPLEVS